MKIDRKIFENIAWDLIILTLLLTIIGLIEIYSATYTFNSLYFFKKQLIWWIISFMGMIFFISFDYRLFKDHAYLIHFFTIFLLIIVLIFGKKTMGAKRWIDLGFFSFQPSELLKLSTILIIAKYFSEDNEDKKYSIKEIFPLIILILFPVFLVIIQPDLGTGLLILLVSSTLLLFIGIEKKSLLKIVILIAFFIPFSWHLLKDYQKQRILTFIFPERDPLGAGYHVIQSKIAIGSGKILGKGLLKGTQNKLAFLPEHHTDFIFSVLGEEFGFIGSVILLIIFLLFLFSCIKVAKNSKDYFGKILTSGIMLLFFWQIFINIGMVIGILPVVGIPLPFISYGGTSLFISYSLVGIVLNVSMRRFMF